MLIVLKLSSLLSLFIGGSQSIIYFQVVDGDDIA